MAARIQLPCIRSAQFGQTSFMHKRGRILSQTEHCSELAKENVRQTLVLNVDKTVSASDAGMPPLALSENASTLRRSGRKKQNWSLASRTIELRELRSRSRFP
jgi:hypothetical protein